MKFAIVILLGAAIVFGLPGIPALYVVAGTLAGFAMMLAEVKWPNAKPTYIDPVSRPKPSTPASGYVAATVVVAASGLLAFVAWKFVLARSPATGFFGIYLAAAGVGMAAGMVLTARQVSEAHNRWLASMTARSQLEF